MHLLRNQLLFLPMGSVVQRVGYGEDLVLADQASARNLHDEDVFVLEDGRIRCRNGLYVKLLASVTTVNDLVVAEGETLYVQPYSAVVPAALVKQSVRNVVYPPTSHWDAAIGSGKIVLVGLIVGFGL